MKNEKFPFYYAEQCYEAEAECLETDNGYRKYRINFPTVLNIVEGTVYVSEQPYGDWEIEKIMSADPVQEEFLHKIAQGFVEYIDTNKN
jgi:hypothetical protein